MALYCAIGSHGSPQCGLPRRFSRFEIDADYRTLNVLWRYFL